MSLPTVGASRIIYVLQLANRAGVDWDRKGFSFRCGETSDDCASDGGPPAASSFYPWCMVSAGGSIILKSGRDFQPVPGPWWDDLPSVLDEIESEARAALAIKEEQRQQEQRASDAAKAQAEAQSLDAQKQKYLSERG